MICDECETVAHCLKNGCVPKTNKKDEAMKQALEALENATSYGSLTGAEWVFDQVDNAITALRTAIEEAEKQEPVACGACNGSGRMVRDPDIGTDQECFVCEGAGVPSAPVQQSRSDVDPVAWMDKYGEIYKDVPEVLSTDTPLYTTPPAQPALKPLTDEQIEHLWETRVSQPCLSYPLEKSDWVQFARAIEAAHGIKGGA